MGESSFSKGLNGGCGVVVALFLAFVVLPGLACGGLGMCGAAANPTLPPVDDPIMDDLNEAEAAIDDALERVEQRRAERTACGLLVGGTDEAGNVRPAGWAESRCRRESAVEAWSRCLARSDYTDNPSRGCPGSERCCP